jgi:hypothetical protein
MFIPSLPLAATWHSPIEESHTESTFLMAKSSSTINIRILFRPLVKAIILPRVIIIAKKSVIF